jgi:hypothetical protein
MSPDVNHGNRDKRVEASGEMFPAYHQAAVLALEPGQGTLGLEARDILVDRPAPWLAALPHPFGNLGADPTLAEAMAKVFGIIPLIRRQDLESFTRSTPFAGADAEALQQRDGLGPLVPVGGRRARR